MMEPLETVQKRSIAEIKEFAERIPEPIKSDILQAPDQMTPDEFLIRFIGWRRQLRVLRTMED